MIGRNVIYRFLQAHDDRAMRWLLERKLIGNSSVSVLTEKFDAGMKITDARVYAMVSAEMSRKVKL